MEQFNINMETGPSKLKELHAAVDELNALVVQCDQAENNVGALDKVMGLEVPAVSLIRSCKEALTFIIPKLDQTLVPIDEFVTNMIAAQEEIQGSTALGLNI